MHLFCRRIAVLAAAALLTACSSDATTQAAEENAMNQSALDRDDATLRADRLDRQAATLDAAGERIGGTRGAEMENEATEDLGTAAAVRREGEAEAEQTLDSVEQH